MIGTTPYEVLYGKKCRSPVYWDDVGERKFLGPEIVREMAEVVIQIRQRMQTAQDQQKSYADQRRRILEFTVGEQVFLKVAPMKEVMRFGKKGKLSPRYIEIKLDLTYEEKSIEILQREIKQLRSKKIPLVKSTEACEVCLCDIFDIAGDTSWVIAEVDRG
ncbi:uncharacterized protein LOC111400230 [Olea europaea var. sylvestris]|uniref:uncharacterized protein LOC111400230 n=1 Tax=Olea europaea var. sylvestris TaxID=158386 RepID=UPI000C1D0849|nr:uncharacterized protein LOC111400230 [Olea europaea var. sylvestris]